MVDRRPCKRCGRNRAERFFASPRGDVCLPCQKKRASNYSKNERLQETYDITLEEWEQILELQGGVCAICEGKRSEYDTDHDHKAERVVGTRASVRGLLCRRCNRRLLPAAQDSTAVLLRAIAYLEAPPAHVVVSVSPTSGE